MSSKNSIFLIFYTALIIIATSLLFFIVTTPYLYSTLKEVLVPTVIAQSFSYSLIGVGIGLPICALSIIFSWVYAILTVTKIVEPHLTGEGFFEALKSLTNGMKVLINKLPEYFSRH